MSPEIEAYLRDSALTTRPIDQARTLAARGLPVSLAMVYKAHARLNLPKYVPLAMRVICARCGQTGHGYRSCPEVVPVCRRGLHSLLEPANVLQAEGGLRCRACAVADRVKAVQTAFDRRKVDGLW